MKKRILCVGEARIDLCMPVGELPRSPKAPILAKSCGFVPSGSAAIAATAVARLGGDSVLCTRLGKDRNGVDLRKIYEYERIDTRFVASDATLPTSFSVIYANETVERQICLSPDASSALSPSDVEGAFICRPDAIIASTDLPRDTLLATARHAAKREIPVYLDGGASVGTFPFDELSPIELFAPDEDETKLLTDVSPDTPEKCLKAAIALSRIVRARFYAIKLGSRGCYIYDGRYYHCLPAYDVKAKDPSAAGDAFLAALTLEHLEHGDVARAGKVANAVGALTVNRRGALVSVPHRKDVAEFIAERAIRL